MRRDERAHDAQPETAKAEQRQQERQRREPRRLDVFAFRSWHDVISFAHFLGDSGFASGFASGFVSAGLSISARCSGGTSAAVAFWLRCNARK